MRQSASHHSNGLGFLGDTVLSVESQPLLAQKKLELPQYDPNLETQLSSVNLCF